MYAVPCLNSVLRVGICMYDVAPKLYSRAKNSTLSIMATSTTYNRRSGNIKG